MKTKHTPGPWRIGKIEDGSTMQIVTEVAASPGGNVFVFSEDSSPLSEGAANARLIAAAPEMLEALKLVLERYGHNPQRMEPEEIFTARAAIAKAEGRAIINDWRDNG